MNREGGETRQLTHVGEKVGGNARGPVLAPDGRTLAFWVEGAGPSSVWLMDLRSTEAVELVPHGAWPSWMPGYPALMFVSSYSGSAQVWITRTPLSFFRYLRKILPGGDWVPDSPVLID